MENEQEDIFPDFPDPLSQAMAAGWQSSPARTLERGYAAIAAAARDRSYA